MSDNPYGPPTTPPPAEGGADPSGSSYPPPGPHAPPPGPPPQPYGAPPPGFGGPRGDKGFFGALFDFSFETFVTPMIVRAVYVIALVVLVLTWLFLTLAAFYDSVAFGVVVLVLGPIAVLLYLALIRMTLEFYYAVVRMSQDINRRLPGR